MNALLLVLVLAQGGDAPLRKSDLVRLLSGSAMTQDEIAQLVSRNCLTFAATERDRQDFLRLGADAGVLAAVDACTRRRAAPPTPRPAARPPARPQPTGSPLGPVTPPAPRPPPVRRPSAERSAFAAGGGQSGSAGSRLPRALLFDVRDSAGAPIAGQAVEFSAVNASVAPPSPVTDADGRVRVGVTLGPRTGHATVIAAVGVVETQVAFNVSAGPVSQLAVACGRVSLAGRVTIGPDSVVTLVVAARDAYGNAALLAGLRAAAADARVFRIVRIAQDSASGSVAVKPEQAGTTSLAVIANGIRQYLSVTVLPRGAREPVDCR